MGMNYYAMLLEDGKVAIPMDSIQLDFLVEKLKKENLSHYVFVQGTRTVVELAIEEENPAIAEIRKLIHTCKSNMQSLENNPRDPELAKRMIAHYKSQIAAYSIAIEIIEEGE